jgi:hypothetical protein
MLEDDEPPDPLDALRRRRDENAERQADEPGAAPMASRLDGDSESDTEDASGTPG